MPSAWESATVVGDTGPAWMSAPEVDAAPSTKQPIKKKAEPIGPAGKLLKGAVDPIEGGAQLLTNVLPESWVKAGNQFNNKLADMGLPVARIPQGGMNQLVQQNEADSNQASN